MVMPRCLINAYIITSSFVPSLFCFPFAAYGQCYPFCQCKPVWGLCKDIDREGTEKGLPSGQELHRRQAEAGG